MGNLIVLVRGSLIVLMGSLGNYQQSFFQLTQNIPNGSQVISRSKVVIQNIYNITDILSNGFDDIIAVNNCEAEIVGADVVMTYACLVHGIYPKLDFQQSIDLVRQDVDQVDKVYDITKAEFDFQGSEINASTIIPLSDYELFVQKKSQLEKIRASLSKKKMIIPVKTLALDQVQSYGIVAADRDISKYGDCAKQNFMVGMKALQEIVLKPGESWNANKQFAYLPGYCKGEGENYMFYMGICGVSSMAYRASILNPNVTISKRASHLQRFTRYYGDDIYGDDAAIYELTKQFEIVNNSNDTMIMRSKIIGDRPYLVMIHPTKMNNAVAIHKSQIGPLTAQITRSWLENGERKSVKRVSSYIAKTDQGN